DQDSRLASDGSTRVENQAIALMREILPAGTKVIKVYAREVYSEPEHIAQSKGRTHTWDWILTTEDANFIGGASAGKLGVLEREVPREMVLDKGRFRFNSTPVATPIRETANPHLSG